MALTVFDAAATLLFADPNLGQDATYTPAAGLPVALRAILNRPDKDIDVGISGLHVATIIASVLASDLPADAAKGDVLTVDSADYRVRQITRDAQGIVAALDLDPV